MPPLGHSMVSVDDPEGHVIGIHNVHDHRGEAGKGVIGVEFDSMHLEEHSVDVYGDLAHVVGVVFR